MRQQKPGTVLVLRPGREGASAGIGRRGAVIARGIAALVVGAPLIVGGCSSGGDSGGAAFVPRAVQITSDGDGVTLAPGGTATVTVALKGRSGSTLGGRAVTIAGPTVGPGVAVAGADSATVNVGRGTTGADGTVRASFTPNAVPGPYLVSVEAPGAGTDVLDGDGAIALTNLAAPVTPAVSAGAARAKAIAGVGAGEQLYGPFLLVPGSVVEGNPLDTDIAGSRARRGRATVSDLTWFFWVDTRPGAVFSHPTRFVTLSASDPGARVVSTDQDWFPYVTTPGGGTHVPLLPAAFLDALPADNDRAASVPPGTGRGRAPSDACAIVVRGPGRRGSRRDVARFTAWLVRADLVTPGNITAPPTVSTPDEVHAAIDAAKAAGCKKLYLHIVAHGGLHGVVMGGVTASNQAVDGTMHYPNLAQWLQGIPEVCITVDACHSGTAIPEMQNYGMTGGIATATDADGYGYMDDTDYWTGFFTRQWIACADMLRTTPPTPGHPTYEEIQKCVQQSGVTGATSGNPSFGTIGATAASLYPLSAAVVQKTGDTVTVTLNRPLDTPINGFNYATLTIADGTVATFADGSKTAQIKFEHDQATQTVTLVGVARGHTTWRFQGHSWTGSVEDSGEVAVDVGSTYLFTPTEVTVRVNGSQEVTLSRYGAVTKLPQGSTVTFTTSDSAIAGASPGTLTYAQDGTIKSLTINAGFTAGTATITATDAANGLSATLTVHVYQEVTLDHPLTSPGGTVYQTGAVIPSTRITGYKIAHPDTCDSWHMHAISPAGIFIDGVGPFPDPNPTACGYGKVVQP